MSELIDWSIDFKEPKKCPYCNSDFLDIMVFVPAVWCVECGEIFDLIPKNMEIALDYFTYEYVIKNKHNWWGLA